MSSPSNLSKIYFNIIPPSTPGFSKSSPSLTFSQKYPCMHISFIHTCHMFCPSHSSWFVHTNNIWRGVQSIKLLVHLYNLFFNIHFTLIIYFHLLLDLPNTYPTRFANLSTLFGHPNSFWPIPVAERSKARVCSRLIAGIAGSNPGEGMDVPLFRVLYFVR